MRTCHWHESTDTLVQWLAGRGVYLLKSRASQYRPHVPVLHGGPGQCVCCDLAGGPAIGKPRTAGKPAACERHEQPGYCAPGATEVDFQKAVQNPVHSGAISGHPTPAELHETREKHGITEKGEETQYPRQGSNL